MLESNISFQAYSENFTGLELEDGGGRGTSGHFPCFSISKLKFDATLGITFFLSDACRITLGEKIVDE